ncbi:metal-dependent hydrolase [Halarchaeum sp. P4]|uniref:metal-dependent hydrolase n=1 Tax=Halarchaeum sp. P4 TaxID=3421639 RepID=UPI003EC02C4A
MMATTHALVGLLLAAGASALTGESSLIVAAAGILGGVFPDLDLYAGHRKTLHFPVYGSLAAVLLVAGYLLIGGPLALAAALFALAAAVHAASDALGGGLELRPWEGTSERAVYDHFNGVWWRPRRLIRYDGAPEDVLLGAAVAVPGYLAFAGPVQTFVLVAVGVSVGYAAIRKPMVALAERLVAATPAPVLDYVPERFVRDVR